MKILVRKKDNLVLNKFDDKEWSVTEPEDGKVDVYKNVTVTDKYGVEKIKTEILVGGIPVENVDIVDFVGEIPETESELELVDGKIKEKK